MSLVDEAKKVLTELGEKVNILGSAVIRTNGLMIVSSLPSESNERMIAAMSAALLGTSKRTAEALFNGNFRSLNLEIDKGNMFLIGAGKVILVVLTDVAPNVGLITLEMESASEKLSKIFG
ncbi:MAG: roadblock/LC7 domain-containing protein [Candidatus Helarchaeota archaeon]